jgi:GDPmannose 4,6-dehydratase
MVGSHLADFLLDQTDWEVWGLLRWRSQLDNIEHLIPRINSGERIFLVYGDLGDELSLIEAVKKARPDYVFHLAAQSYPKTSFDSPIETLDTNILGTVRLLESIRHLSLDPWIHVCSSSEVFGRVSKDKLPIAEDTNFHPASPYAISKAGTDLFGKFYSEAYGMKVLVTRMFTHTGPRRGDVFAESSFAKQIAMIENGLLPPLVEVGNLNSLRTFADVRDAVRAYHLLLTLNPISGEYYNIGGAHTCTVGEMLETLLNYSSVRNIEVKVVEERLRPIDADLQVPDTSKFRRHTGWEPKIPFSQTMGDLLDYWRGMVVAGRRFLKR